MTICVTPSIYRVQSTTLSPCEPLIWKCFLLRVPTQYLHDLKLQTKSVAFLDAKTRNPVESCTAGRGTSLECKEHYLLVTGILWKAGCMVISAHQHHVCGFKQITIFYLTGLSVAQPEEDFWAEIVYDMLLDCLVTLTLSLISPCVPQTSSCLAQSHSSPPSCF